MEDDHLFYLLAVILPILSLLVTLKLLPQAFPLLLKAGLSGGNLNAPAATRSVKIPESAGIVGSFVAISMMNVLIVLYPPFRDWIPVVLSTTFMTLLGFVDDVLNLRWRMKLVVPFICAFSIAFTTQITNFIPLLVIKGEIIGITVPFAVSVTIIACLIVFFVNAINIYAGVNGLEVGQSILLGASLLAQIFTYRNEIEHSKSAIIVLLLFIAVSYALYRYNRFPAKCFIGDTYCYYAGAILVSVAVKTGQQFALCTFALPQLINFVFSLPQLVGLIKCPRHRLPKLDEDSMKLKSMWKASPPHLTFINFWLYMRGNMSEKRLVGELLSLQFILSLISLVTLAPVYGNVM